MACQPVKGLLFCACGAAQAACKSSRSNMCRSTMSDSVAVQMSVSGLQLSYSGQDMYKGQVDAFWVLSKQSNSSVVLP